MKTLDSIYPLLVSLLAFSPAQAEVLDSSEPSPAELHAEIQELERLGVADDRESDEAFWYFIQEGAGRLKIEIFQRPRGYGIDSEFLVTSVDGEVQNVFLTSSGLKPGWTPPGTFKVYRMHTVYTSRKYNAPMDYAQFFNGGIAIHSTISDNYPMLGKPASKGCVRLSRPAAKKLFHLTQKHGVANTTVVVHAAGAQPASQLIPYLEDAIKRDRANIQDLLNLKRWGTPIDRGGRGDEYPREARRNGSLRI